MDLTVDSPAPTDPDLVRLPPRDGALYVVRWARKDGHGISHRYYRRHADADYLRRKLTENRFRLVGIYETATAWSEVFA